MIKAKADGADFRDPMCSSVGASTVKTMLAAPTRELYERLGKAYVYIDKLEEDNRSKDALIEFWGTRIDSLEADRRSLQQRLETMQLDLDRAMSLADLSQQGANTPHPFPVNVPTVKFF